MVSCSWHWKVLTLIAKWIGDKKKQEEWLRGIFVWWFVCFRYANLELLTAQQNTCKFQKMTQRVFDVFRVPNVWGTFFGVSGYMDVQIQELKLFSKFQGEDFGRFVWCFRCSCEFLGWYRLFNVIHRDVSQPFQDAGSAPTGLSHPKLFTIDLHATSRTLFVYCDAFARATACG